MNTCKLPRHAQQLAWLDMNSEAGQEYWLTMTLAGDYAKACHERIHANLLKALGLTAYSASHGAGRAMSRQKAKDSMTVSAMKKLLSSAGVSLIGGTVEENPLAYKDIEAVITAQRELVDIQGKFFPRIVRMNKD